MRELAVLRSQLFIMPVIGGGPTTPSLSNSLALVSARAHAAVVAALSIADFSLIAFRGEASWLLNLRFKALSTFAPKANLLKFSLFSALGTNRCCCRRLLSRR